MLAHIKLQDETMTEHGDIIDQLDELVGLATLRTAAHDKFTEGQIENRRLANEPKTAYFCIAASFIAQRACHTAQANALLLRHGFADQAFELWRTLFNLELVMAHLCSGDNEDRAERYLSATPAELDFLDEEARELGMDFARPFADFQKKNVDQSLNQLVNQYGKRIKARDGWIDPASKPDAKSRAADAGITPAYYLYQLAGKLHHASPVSIFMRATAKPTESWNVLGHSTEGVHIQCFLTASALHRIVSDFCDATDEIRIYEDGQWFEQSGALLEKISTLFQAGPVRKPFSMVPNDSGLVSGMEDPKATKQLLEDEDVEHYLRAQNRLA